jgi:hypothetical protein
LNLSTQRVLSWKRAFCYELPKQRRHQPER